MSPFGVFDAARTAVRMIGRAAKVQAYEVALMASVAAMAPLHLVGGGFDPSCGPRSPVQAHTAPTTRPVLLVHGLGGTKSSWSLLAQALSARGLTVEAVTYTPIGTSVEQLADRLVVEVDRMLSRTGSDKVHLVGHSLGGVVIAQAIAGGRLNGLVDTVVTLGSPFGGTPWANLLPFGAIVRALREGFAIIAPTRLRAGTGRRAVAGIHGRARHDRAGPAVGAGPHPSGDRNGRRRRSQRNAPKSGGCRPHRRRLARMRLGLTHRFLSELHQNTRKVRKRRASSSPRSPPEHRHPPRSDSPEPRTPLRPARRLWTRRSASCGPRATRSS